MKINYDGLNILLKLLSQESFDEELYNEFVNTNDFKDFIEHENNLGRKTTKESVKENLIQTMNGIVKSENVYGFDYVFKYRNEINKKINELEFNNQKFHELILNRLSRYVDLDLFNNNFSINLYGGGFDYGFSEKENICYINIALLADKLEFLDDIVAHEYYHSRIRSLSIADYDFSKENYFKTLLYHILEEGIATLIQFEYEKKYDGFAFIDKERFDNIDTYMKNLDLCIRECELNNNYTKEVVLEYFQDSIPNYIVGYKIGQIIFKYKGKDGLKIWNRDCDYLNTLKSYINICRNEGINSGFSNVVEDYILNLI